MALQYSLNGYADEIYIYRKSLAQERFSAFIIEKGILILNCCFHWKLAGLAISILYSMHSSRHDCFGRSSILYYFHH